MRNLWMLCFALCLPLTLHAQEASRTESVPRELVLALIGFRAPEEAAPEIRVGRAPPEFPSSALPPQARVLGSLIRRSSLPTQVGITSSTVVIVSPEEPDSALDLMEQGLLRIGWESLSFDRPMGGFVIREIRSPRVFCKGELFLNISARPRDGERGSLLHATQDSGRPGPCDREKLGPSPLPPPGARMPPMPPIPQLHVPEGATSEGGGITGRGRDHWESSTRLQTPRSAQDLVAHYSAQLQQGGWTPVSRASGRGMATQTFRVQDPTGQTWHGVLLAVTLPGTGQYEVIFRAMRPSTGGQVPRSLVTPDRISR